MQIAINLDTSDLQKVLKSLPDKIANEASEKALVAGGETIVKHAKINAENHGLHRTGDLINSIQVYDANPLFCWVGSRGVIYAAVHEFGATILPKRVKMLHWIDDNGNDVFASRVVIPARPYLRPAIDEHKLEVMGAMSMILSKALAGT